MKIIYTVALILIFTLGGFCNSPPPDPDPGEGDVIEGDTTGDQQVPVDDISQPEEEPVNRVCLFKENHIISEVEFSGPNILLEGSDEEKEIAEIIEEKHFLNFGPFTDFSDGEAGSVEKGVLVISYDYDGDDYSDWCPEEGECVVEVVYKGATGDAIYQKKQSYLYEKWTSSFDGYVYKGNLTVQIRFPGQVLDFSGCP